jgi:hypothetical protein
MAIVVLIFGSIKNLKTEASGTSALRYLGDTKIRAKRLSKR